VLVEASTFLSCRYYAVALSYQHADKTADRLSQSCKKELEAQYRGCLRSVHGEFFQCVQGIDMRGKMLQIKSNEVVKLS
jgi:hypothetical protein